MSPAELARRRAFYKRVQRRLEELGWNHAEFARRIGKSSGVVGGYFNKLSMPMGDDLIKWPEILKCNGHWLLTGQGPAELTNGRPSTDYRAGFRQALMLIERAVDAARTGKE